MCRLLAVSSIVLVLSSLHGSEVLIVTGDDTRVERSCRVQVGAGTVIEDLNGDGVLHIGADNITVEMAAGSVLRGASEGQPWDELTGIGLRVEGRTNVTVRGFRVRGFKVGLFAREASGLTIEGGDLSDNYRQRLRSTPEAEDSGDWLYPHRNDTVRWRDEYGAAVCIEQSARVTIRDLRVRRGQNGIVLDRVHDSRVFDNDCSFLSGWGLALWRSSRNIVSRNAFDFCVRGHVEGVYNRGQDSAGILCFEQSNHNVFAENSATHGGDGFFGFAGREATGEVWRDRERERLRHETGLETVDDRIQPDPALVRELSNRGCNHNLLLRNDFSYAAAHGIEITFSEWNRIENNRLVENAICGIWGGYSSWTRITGNQIEGNGGMAYGLERGGVNMEHASFNWLHGNRFRNNKCGIHFWWDNDEDLLKLPGVQGHGVDVLGNQIVGNRFILDAAHPFRSMRSNETLVVLQLRDDSGTHMRETVYAQNSVLLKIPQARELAVAPGLHLANDVREPPHQERAAFDLHGTRKPVGARAHLRGREQILIDAWGPWDHEQPLIRSRRAGAGEARFDLLGFEGEPRVQVTEGELQVEWLSAEATATTRQRQLVLRGQPGVTPYRVKIETGDFTRELSGTLVAAQWRVTVFPWSIDPREDRAGWLEEARSEQALTADVGALAFPYGWGGPRDQAMSDDITHRGPASDRFGMIATTRINLPAGRWLFRTISDDGVRVRVDGKNVIENWTWHGPTQDQGIFLQNEDREVAIEVEHFEIDGFATLTLQIEAAARQ